MIQLRKLLPDPRALLFPRLCVLCTAPLGPEVAVCDPCLAQLAPVGPDDAVEIAPGGEGVDRGWCAFRYDDAMQTLVHLLKYGGHRGLGRRLALAVHRQLEEEVPWREYDYLVPIPLHRGKQRQRGYNQSRIIAETLAELVEVPVNNALVFRLRWTQSQTGLTRAQRRANVEGSFRFGGEPSGLKLLLIDDVLTTGATASACAEALKAGGCAEAAVLAVATPPAGDLTLAAL